MQQRVLKIVLGVIMSMLLSFNLGIRQYFHSFSNHTDTVHKHDNASDKNDGVHFEKEHHHCDYQFELLAPHLNATIAFIVKQKLKDEFEAYNASKYTFYFQSYSHYYSLRGPPVV